ncbi:hypothetical protein SAMN04487926_14216 [Paraburkholderia steynii]|uniref:Uncharacterized protein n=1 Tax=Paraburkholderia steynii TaxID=1245441 RepID=A0A7Z7BIA2_9BURK|nr:hypothetical protein [Paraburkholderia steynii]SDJ30580.1 hypothetical protein SAMN04487926_14216 [Paraburkholderia steynii]
MQQITLLAGTPMMPDVPVMVIYAPVDNRRGILYVVEGAYIADILARARTSGARSASVSDGTGGTITSDGRFVKTDAHAPDMSEILVRVEADAARLRADLILTEIFALLAGTHCLCGADWRVSRGFHAASATGKTGSCRPAAQ